MANPLMIIKLSGIEKKGKNEKIDNRICELVCKAFTTRNLLHFAHWTTKSFASHLALGDLYDSIVDDIDEIVECYSGKFGVPKEFYTEKATVPSDIVSHIEDEMNWVEENRVFISKGNSSIENLIDTLLGHYQKVLYKLKNLS